MEPNEIVLLVFLLGVIISVPLLEKIDAIDKIVSEIPTKILIFITSPTFIVSIFILSLVGLFFLFIRHRVRRIKRERQESIIIEEEKEKEKEIVDFMHEKIKGLSSNKLEKLIQVFEQYDYDSRIQNKIKATKKELREVRIEEYHKTEEYKKHKLLEEIEEIRNQKYREQLRLKDYHDAILMKLNIEETLIYEIDRLNKKEIEVLKKEDYKKTNEYDPIEKRNINFLVKQILNHSPSHTFLVARIKQLLERYIGPKNIRTHDTRDADITFEVKYKIYAFEIEKGSLLTKKKELRRKVSLLNNKYGQNWYFIVTNRDLAKKYREYGKVTTRMGVCKIIEKLIKK